MLAGFLVMVFLIPFDGTQLKVHLPVDSKLDRFVLGAMIVVLIFQSAASSQSLRVPRRMTAVAGAVLLFTGIALLSVVVNVDRIYRLGELTLAEKRVSQLLAYVLFFWVVARTVRPTEMRAFGRLILVLAGVTAVGVLYESRTGVNLFYLWSSKLLSPIASVIPSPTNIHPTVDRKVVVGPTGHGLALASMLTIALPFAIVRLFEPQRPSRRLLYLVLIGLLLAASLATARKTAIVAPLAAFAVLAAYHRRLLRWAPVALIVLIPVVHFASPGALGTFDVLASAGDSNSTVGRIDDYAAVAPDIASRPLLGMGFGTFDPNNLRWYRILDNEYLGELVQVGILGLIAYVAIVLSALVSAHGVIKQGGTRAPPMLAAAAGCAAYGLVSVTFDALSFPQAPYMFFFAAGLIAAGASVELPRPPMPSPNVLRTPSHVRLPRPDTSAGRGTEPSRV